MNHRNQPGLTLTEALVAIGIVGALFCTAMTGLKASAYRGPSAVCLSNMKQLQLVAQSMALDGVITGNTNLGWPGDIGGSFSHWSTLVVKEGYLSQRDLCKLLSAPGKAMPDKFMPVANTNGILMYAVRESSPGETTFFTSGNFTNTPTGGTPLVAGSEPFGNKGFVVFRKGGDGAILSPGSVGNTNQVGLFVPLCR